MVQGVYRYNRISLKRLIQLERESAERIARESSAAGFARELKVWRTNLASDPSNGGSRGYDVWHRKIILEFAAVYSPEQASAIFQVSMALLYRREDRKQEEGCSYR